MLSIVELAWALLPSVQPWGLVMHLLIKRDWDLLVERWPVLAVGIPIYFSWSDTPVDKVARVPTLCTGIMTAPVYNMLVCPAQQSSCVSYLQHLGFSALTKCTSNRTLLPLNTSDALTSASELYPAASSTSQLL
jgi:hypothetical protein